MDQVSEQGGAVGGDEDRGLRDGGHAEHGERDSDRPQTFARALDAVVHQAVAVIVRMVAAPSARGPLAIVRVRTIVGVVVHL